MELERELEPELAGGFMDPVPSLADKVARVELVEGGRSSLGLTY